VFFENLSLHPRPQDSSGAVDCLRNLSFVIGPPQIRWSNQTIGISSVRTSLPVRGLWSTYRSSAVDVGLWAFNVIISPEEGRSMFLRNVGLYLQVHTALKPP
jgi:hypothetical protein